MALANDKNQPQPENGKVGYCRPPKHGQFKPGQSGNPKGRPKGTLNLATVLERTLREKVVITKNGRRKVVTKLEAAVSQLVDQAASGDLKAMQQLAGLARSAEEQVAQAEVPKQELAKVDREVLQGIMKRFENISNGEAK